MRVRLEYRDKPARSPLTPWVHTGLDGPWWRATAFDPALPRMLKGYPVWVVEHRGRTIYFVSRQEIDHAIDILGRKILPMTRDLGKPHRAVNSHWLSRLHSSWKPWKVRFELVKRLKAAPEP